MKKLALIAIGGNSLIRPGQQGTPDEQRENAALTMKHVVQLIQQGYRVLITHGNGPQVGAQLLRSELSADQVWRQPLDLCVAETQGSIGSILEQALREALQEAALAIPLVSMITHVVVDEEDPAFAQPSKPVGMFYPPAEAKRRMHDAGWIMAPDGERGYRRLVPSPEPQAIVQLEEIRQLVDSGCIVIAAGGGGIPVVKREGRYTGVEAVIDKDKVSALLAHQMDADIFIISTAEDRVYVNYRQPNQHALVKVKATRAEKYYRLGNFPAGSMGPKIQAALWFLKRGGHEVIITTPECLPRAVCGKAGTHIYPDEVRKAA